MRVWGLGTEAAARTEMGSGAGVGERDTAKMRVIERKGGTAYFHFLCLESSQTRTQISSEILSSPAPVRLAPFLFLFCISALSFPS